MYSPKFLRYLLSRPFNNASSFHFTTFLQSSFIYSFNKSLDIFYDEDLDELKDEWREAS